MPRTKEQLEVVPPYVDAAVGVLSGLGAAVAVSPFLMCVDRAVVAHSAGTAPGGSLFRAIVDAASEFVTKPRVAFRSPALWMVAGVYGATYAAANLSDSVSERSTAESSVKAVGKFATVTAANMTGGILKDAAFAKLFGSAAGAAAAASAAPPAVVVPAASYALFAVRDCLTIGGAFFVPNTLSTALCASGSVDDETAAGAVAQLVSPPLMQVVCTPMHLLALNLVNAPGATAAVRMSTLQAATPAALLARSLRMLPAYGIGGLLNAALTKRGRDVALAHYDTTAVAVNVNLTAATAADATVVSAEDMFLSSSGDRVASEVESGTPLDSLFGDDQGEHYLHKFARFLYGGDGSIHPNVLAAPADIAAWSFRWERLIQNSVSHQLAEHGGGDTIGGCVVVGGDAEVDAAVDAFVARVDMNGDGKLSVADVEAALTREKDAGVGWAAMLSRKEGEKGLSSAAMAAGLVLSAAASQQASSSKHDDDEEPSVTAEDIKNLLKKKIKGYESE